MTSIITRSDHAPDARERLDAWPQGTYRQRWQAEAPAPRVNPFTADWEPDGADWEPDGLTKPDGTPLRYDELRGW